MKKSIFFATVGLLASTSALAEASTDSFLGIKGSSANFKDIYDDVTISDRNAGFGIEYTAITNSSVNNDTLHVGINIGLDKFTFNDTISTVDIQYDVRLITVAPELIYKPYDNFDLYGKIGLGFWDVNAKAQTSSASATASESGDDFLFGVGMTFRSGNGLYSGIEYSKLDVTAAKFDMISLRIGLQF